MNGEATSTKRVPIEEIFTLPLLEHAQQVAFPWGVDEPLNATKVATVFFGDHESTGEWDVPEVKATLKKLADIGIDNIRLDDFPEFVITASAEHGELSAWQRNMGMILTLDQGALHVCKGVNARYIFHFFQLITVHSVKKITHYGTAHLTDWEAAGVDKNQAILRSLTMIAALIHSENIEDHNHHQRLIDQLRKEYESLTKTRDPYRQSFAQDSEDIYLYLRMLEEGPPLGKGVHMHDLVYWLMRYYKSHIAFLRHFGRSPFRNVAVGRDDAEGEVEWLRMHGVEWTEEDEMVREMIKEDVEKGRWRPLEL